VGRKWVFSTLAIIIIGVIVIATFVIATFVTLVSPCMEGSLIKAACNNNDSLCCNDSKFIVESN